MSDRFPLPPYQWPAPHRAGAIVSVNVEGEAPLAWQHRGQTLTTLGELEARRFGPREGVWRILSLLDEIDRKASFYVSGLIADAYPAIAPAIAARGHEVGLHGWFHEVAAEATYLGSETTLSRAIGLLHGQTGARPVGHRGPGWDLTTVSHELLRTAGIIYDSSMQGLEHPYGFAGLVEIPAARLTEDAPWFNPGPHTAPASPDAVLATWMDAFDAAREQGSLFHLTIRPWLSGGAQRIRLLRALFRHMARAEDVWWTTAEAMARFHLASPNAETHVVTIEPLDTNVVV